MIVDLCIVLYRPRWSELAETLLSLRSCVGEFNRINILMSGNKSDHNQLRRLLTQLRLADSSSVFTRYDNLGFAGGQNLLLNEAFAAGADFAIAFNPDLTASPGSIASLTHLARENASSLIGPELLSVSETGQLVVDSRGIEWTASGRHFDIDAGALWNPATALREPVRVQGLTGACLLVGQYTHARMTEPTGQFFDESFIAYREDAELGVRAQILGVQSICVPSTGFRHARSVKKASRASKLVNALSVQNRFIMRWVLGARYPGSTVRVCSRDVLVIVACLTVERSSLAALFGAYRQRRYSRYKGEAYLNLRS